MEEKVNLNTGANSAMIEKSLAAAEVHANVKQGFASAGVGLAGIFLTLIAATFGIMQGAIIAGVFMLAELYLIAKFAKKQKYLETNYEFVAKKWWAK